MTAYRVYLNTTASLSIKVEINDEGLDVEEARERAIEEAFQEIPSSLCAQCSGWRQPWSLDLGEFEVDEPVEVAVEKVEG